MAALTDAAARVGCGTADEAAQRLLPSDGGGGVEMTSVTIDAFRGGGAARRRARVLERLESLDPETHGGIDKQQLVGTGGGPSPGQPLLSGMPGYECR